MTYGHSTKVTKGLVLQIPFSMTYDFSCCGNTTTSMYCTKECLIQGVPLQTVNFRGIQGQHCRSRIKLLLIFMEMHSAQLCMTVFKASVTILNAPIQQFCRGYTFGAFSEVDTFFTSIQSNQNNQTNKKSPKFSFFLLFSHENMPKISKSIQFHWPHLCYPHQKGPSLHNH